MINFSRDIQSLSTFKRNTNKMIEQMKATGDPKILTINGKAELVVQDAKAYQEILDKLNRLETIVIEQETGKNTSASSELLDLYGAAADLELKLDDQGISSEMDDNLTGIFDE